MNQVTTDAIVTTESDGDDGERNQFLTFQLSGDVFGLEILNIKEILEYGAVTSVPMMPDYIHGVINLRGSVVPVINLANRLGRESNEVGRRTCIVIAEVNHEEEVMDIGVVIDAVNEVLKIPATEIEPPPSFGAKIRTDFIRGMGKVNENFVILLNVEKVLSIGELSVIGGLVDGIDGEEIQSQKEEVKE